jgi:hypothetical protein
MILASLGRLIGLKTKSCNCLGERMQPLAADVTRSEGLESQLQLANSSYSDP